MLSDFEHQKAIAHHRANDIRAHLAQDRLTRMAISPAHSSGGLRRGMVRRVVRVSDRAGRWLLNFSARLEAADPITEVPVYHASQVR
jgi:hypothetical protein